MIYKSPDTPLRVAYINAIKAVNPTLPVWAKKVPKGVTVPNLYVLISSQSKNATERSKDCWEWLCTINIDIFYKNLQGYSDTVKVDNAEAQVIIAIENGINVQGFSVKSINLLDSNDLDIETPTESIERRVLTYEHWICQI